MDEKQTASSSAIELHIPDAQTAEKLRLVDAGKPNFTFNYKFRSFFFRGGMYFRDGKLYFIQINSDQVGACRSAGDYLTSEYGTPDIVQITRNGAPTTVPVWLDRKRHNKITVFDIELIHACIVQYANLDSGKDTL